MHRFRPETDDKGLLVRRQAWRSSSRRRSRRSPVQCGEWPTHVQRKLTAGRIGHGGQVMPGGKAGRLFPTFENRALTQL